MIKLFVFKDGAAAKATPILSVSYRLGMIWASAENRYRSLTMMTGLVHEACDGSIDYWAGDFNLRMRWETSMTL